ncbi:MAG: SDR family oxidoreductase [Actinobacteria bacterium]|nr:SDR family oxidoreductase [Actinomycetota bacterium]
MAGVEGRVVIVTGAGGGIGRQHALLFAERGARVVVNDLGGAVDGSGGDTRMADQVVDEIRDAGGDAVANYDSVASAEGGERMVQTALDAYGRVDVVVNNAGILRDKTFHKMTDEHWESVIQVHLQGGYYVTHAAWPHMREQEHGRVIVTTSTTGLFGNFGQTNYGAAKLGLVGMINTLALEGAKYGITANAITPVAATRMTEDLMPDEALQELDPAFVSPAVVHLASDECELSGEILLASGGHYARVRYHKSQGVDFDEVPSVEELVARWDEIMDMDGAVDGKDYWRSAQRR